MADPKVKSLTIKRDGNAYKATWKVPSPLKKKADKLRVKETVSVTSVASGWYTADYSNSKDSYTWNLAKLTTGGRKGYYPCTDVKVKSFTIKVYGRYKDKKGTWHSLDAESETFTVKVPKAPSVSLSIGSGSDALEFNVTVEDSTSGTSAAERYDTVANIYAQASGGKEVKVAGSTFTGSEKVISYNPTAYALGVDQWVKVQCRAQSRGLRGKSDERTVSHVYAHPAVATITAVKVSGQQVLVSVKSNSTYYRPVDSMQLMRWQGTSLSTGFDGWTEVADATGSANVTGLHDSLNAATPAVGERVWYAVKTVHDTYTAYSAPIECKQLYIAKETSVASVAQVLSAEDNGDGDSVTVKLGWKADAKWDSTKVSWSTDQMAWQSNDEPSPFTIEDAKWELGTQGALTTATAKIVGLDDGSVYFFRAKRASSANGDAEGLWSDAVDVRVSSVPTVPVLTAPSVSVRGSSIVFSWTSNRQSAWVLEMHEEGSYRAQLASGEGEQTTATVAYADVKAQLGKDPESVAFRVGVSSGGDYTWSDAASVTFADVPVAVVSATDETTIDSRSWGFKVTCDQLPATASVELVSNGIVVGRPDGNVRQCAGEVVWADTVDCVAALDEDAVYTTVPLTAELADTGGYVLRVTPTANGLTGETVELPLAVAWKHQAAPAPSCAIEVDSVAYSAVVTPQEPADALGTDVFDLYRQTPDGDYLVAQGASFGSSVTDVFAPFADVDGVATAYRVCTRTADGDLAWDDFTYELTGSSARVDWDGGHLELPCDISLSDAWEKGFDARTYLDGTPTQGFWDGSTTRTASLSASAVRTLDDDALDALRRLARYAGPAFVRTPDGCAYEADVQVLGLDGNARYSTVALKATEVELQSFLASIGAAADGGA